MLFIPGAKPLGKQIGNIDPARSLQGFRQKRRIEIGDFAQVFRNFFIVDSPSAESAALFAFDRRSDRDDPGILFAHDQNRHGIRGDPRARRSGIVIVGSSCLDFAGTDLLFRFLFIFRQPFEQSGSDDPLAVRSAHIFKCNIGSGMKDPIFRKIRDHFTGFAASDQDRLCMNELFKRFFIGFHRFSP